MEAGTTPAAETEAPPVAPPSPNGSQPPPDAETSPAERQDLTTMYQYSEYVHLGPGAEECEDKENGSCGNPTHFHAWCRLPNQFQNSSIREKALGAKARKMRQLRDPDTDVHAVLESEMDLLRRLADRDGHGALVEDMLQQTFLKDHMTAVRELGEEEEWSTIREDQERFRVLSRQPEEERPADEFKELEKRITAYETAVEGKRKELQEPQRKALEELTVDDLIEQIRTSRIEQEGNEDFMRVYSMWEWYLGTMKPKRSEQPGPGQGIPTERMFASIDHLQEAAPEVISALEAVFGKLEQAAGTKAALGNS